MGRRPGRPPVRVWLWLAATLALVGAAVVLWRGSDAAATESTTAGAVGVPPGTPAPTVSELWSADASALAERVVEGNRVLVGSEHGVRALDPRDGEEAWRYTRSNAALCDLAVTDGVAVAVFRTENRCDEAVALHADTGVRAWTRNVSFAGDVLLKATDGIVLAVGRQSVVALDPTNNGIRWRYEAPQRCRLVGAEVGEAGVALLQRCSRTDAVQLRVLDGFTGDPHWSRDLPGAADAGADAGADADGVALLGADRVIGVVVGDEVSLLAGDDGAPLATLPVAGDVAMSSVGAAVLVLADGTLRAYDPGSGSLLWQTAALGLPAPAAGPTEGERAEAVLVPEASGFVPRDALTGEPRGRSSAVEDLQPGGTATGLGPVIIHRTNGSVTAYR